MLTDLLFERGDRTGGLADPDVANLTNRVANLMHRGLIVSVDLVNSVAKVQVGEVQTAALPWLASRAGGDITWWAPEIGEQVLVVCPCGNLSQGVIVGSLYRDANPAPANSPDQHVIRYSDGTTIVYDRAAHKLSIHVVGDVEVTADGAATVQARTISAVADEDASLTAKNVSVTASDGITISGKILSSLRVQGSIKATGAVQQNVPPQLL